MFVKAEGMADLLWRSLFEQLTQLCVDERPEVCVLYPASLLFSFFLLSAPSISVP